MVSVSIREAQGLLGGEKATASGRKAGRALGMWAICRIGERETWGEEGYLALLVSVGRDGPLLA